MTAHLSENRRPASQPNIQKERLFQMKAHERQQSKRTNMSWITCILVLVSLGFFLELTTSSAHATREHILLVRQVKTQTIPPAGSNGPMPQTKEHILLARKFDMPSSTQVVLECEETSDVLNCVCTGDARVWRHPLERPLPGELHRVRF